MTTLKTSRKPITIGAESHPNKTPDASSRPAWPVCPKARAAALKPRARKLRLPAVMRHV